MVASSVIRSIFPIVLTLSKRPAGFFVNARHETMISFQQFTSSAFSGAVSTTAF